MPLRHQHDWENRYENGVWTYSLEDIWGGLQDAYIKLAADVQNRYGVVLKKIGAIGFSAMAARCNRFKILTYQHCFNSC